MHEWKIAHILNSPHTYLSSKYAAMHYVKSWYSNLCPYIFQSNGSKSHGLNFVINSIQGVLYHVKAMHPHFCCISTPPRPNVGNDPFRHPTHITLAYVYASQVSLACWCIHTRRYQSEKVLFILLR